MRDTPAASWDATALRDAARASADLLSLACWKAVVQWGLIFWHYYRMMQRIKKDPAAKSYSDEAMRLPAGSNETDKIVELFADKIPHTHGAPVLATSGVSGARLRNRS